MCLSKAMTLGCKKMDPTNTTNMHIIFVLGITWLHSLNIKMALYKILKVELVLFCFSSWIGNLLLGPAILIVHFDRSLYYFIIILQEYNVSFTKNFLP